MAKKKNARVTNPRESRKKVSTRGEKSSKLKVESLKLEEDGTDYKSAPAPLIHVLVRTHQRPGYFGQCVDSIANQVYANKVVHVIADDAESEAYARKAMEDGLVDEVTRVNAKDFTGFGDFNFLQRQGYCKNKSDFRKHAYDLYLNAEMERIEDGYIFIVDDDKVLPDPMLLNRIAANLAEDVVVVGQYAMKKRTLPIGERWGKLPFERAHIDMSCVVFHVKHKDLAKLDGHGAGDWRMCNRLARKMKVVWMEEPFVVADNNGNVGKAERNIKR